MKKNVKKAVSALQDSHSAKVTDNTAASNGNSGTIRIGKGSDESVTTNVEIKDTEINISLPVAESVSEGCSQSGKKKTTDTKMPTNKKAKCVKALQWATIVLLTINVVIRAISFYTENIKWTKQK